MWPQLQHLSPYRRRVIPTPIAKNPLIMITTNSFKVKAVFKRKRKKPVKIRHRAAIPTLTDAVTGSTPSAMTGPIIAPAGPNAPSSPSRSASDPLNQCFVVLRDSFDPEWQLLHLL